MGIDRRRLGRILRVLLAVAGVIFLVIAFRETWDRSREHVLPGWWHVAGAQAFILVSLAGAARSWVCLFDRHGSERALAGAFFTAQLGKYVPGAIWQAVGQVGLSRRGGVSLAQATTAFPVHALTQVAAGGTVGAALAAVGFHLPLATRMLCLLGLLLVVPLRRTWMLGVVRFLTRVLRRGSADALPSQGAILRSFGWGIWALLWSGAAFALLAYSVRAADSAAAAVPAFALAWTVGFLAVPFPSGIGVREGVLIAAAGSPAGAASVIAASIVHRLVTMVGEAAMILFSRWRR